MDKVLRQRNNNLFSSALASSSCNFAIIETKSNKMIIEMIKMMNDFNTQRKHLLIKSPILDVNIFQNITINFEVTLEKSGEGEMQDIIYNFFFLSQFFYCCRWKCFTFFMSGSG